MRKRKLTKSMIIKHKLDQKTKDRLRKKGIPFNSKT